MYLINYVLPQNHHSYNFKSTDNHNLPSLEEEFLFNLRLFSSGNNFIFNIEWLNIIWDLAIESLIQSSFQIPGILIVFMLILIFLKFLIICYFFSVEKWRKGDLGITVPVLLCSCHWSLDFFLQPKMENIFFVLFLFFSFFFLVFFLV